MGALFVCVYRVDGSGESMMASDRSAGAIMDNSTDAVSSLAADLHRKVVIDRLLRGVAAYHA